MYLKVTCRIVFAKDQLQALKERKVSIKQLIKDCKSKQIELSAEKAALKDKFASIEIELKKLRGALVELQERHHQQNAESADIKKTLGCCNRELEQLTKSVIIMVL